MSKAKPAKQLVESASKSKKKTPAPIVQPMAKLDTIIALLKRPKGATLEDMMEATGWQRHSIHGTLSGTIKKKRGLLLITDYGERGRMYRIADAR